jgi:hypothetical protein
MKASDINVELIQSSFSPLIMMHRIIIDIMTGRTMCWPNINTAYANIRGPQSGHLTVRPFSAIIDYRMRCG